MLKPHELGGEVYIPVAAAALVLEHLLSPMRAKKMREEGKLNRTGGQAKQAKPISPKSQEQGFLAGGKLN